MRNYKLQRNDKSYCSVSDLIFFHLFILTQFNYYLKKRDVIIRYVVSGSWIWDRDAPQYYAISVAGKDEGRLY